MQCLIGKKIGMTRVFDEGGKMVSVTVVQTGKNVIHQVKTDDNDGYRSVQLGFEELAEKKVNKPKLGHFKKLGSTPTRIIKEFTLEKVDEDPQPGARIGVEVLDGVKFVDVTGVSKGRGHAGTVKRHNFTIGRKTHGNTSVRERGSTGACSYPARVFPGLKMSGHYGAEQVTVKRLEVVNIDKENDIVLIRGSIPGKNKGIVYIKKTTYGK